MTERTNKTDSIWQEIKQKIEYGIINGTYQSTQKLPSLRQLTEIYQCGNSTMLKILNSMCEEGTLMNKARVGYYVKPFVKEELLDKYSQKWLEQIDDSIKEAYMLGISKEQLETIMNEKISTIYPL